MKKSALRLPLRDGDLKDIQTVLAHLVAVRAQLRSVLESRAVVAVQVVISTDLAILGVDSVSRGFEAVAAKRDSLVE